MSDFQKDPDFDSIIDEVDVMFGQVKELEAKDRSETERFREFIEPFKNLFEGVVDVFDQEIPTLPDKKKAMFQNGADHFYRVHEFLVQNDCLSVYKKSLEVLGREPIENLDRGLLANKLMVVLILKADSSRPKSDIINLIKKYRQLPIGQYFSNAFEDLRMLLLRSIEDRERDKVEHPDSDAMTKTELANVARVSESTIKRAIAKGQLKPVVKGGGRGRQARYHYLEIRPILEESGKRKLPNVQDAIHKYRHVIRSGKKGKNRLKT